MPQNTAHADSISSGQGEHSTLSYTGKKKAQDAKEQKAGQHVPGQVVFLVDNDKAGLASLDRVAKKYHLDVDEKTVLKSLNRIMVVSSTAKDAAKIAEALKNESGVYNSQPNYVFTTMDRQDPLSPMQNLASMLNLQEVHGKVSGKNVAVAVVDTGVEVEHEDLRSRIVGYQNFISGSVYQGEIHGTAVAGIIGADKNENGIVGIAPDVSLLALRACRQVSKMSAMGECFSTSLVRSLDAAISAKVDVVNLSLGAYVNDTLLSVMIDSGHKKGIVFAAPVGNDPTAENIAFPASHDKVISVAGLDELGNPLPNKQLASMADAVAPATHLFVTTPGNSYNFIDGTSLASASISGIIALSMEKKIARNSPCLPRFNSAVPWPKQVFTCIGL
jgi:subtilisin family serine protease